MVASGSAAALLHMRALTDRQQDFGADGAPKRTCIVMEMAPEFQRLGNDGGGGVKRDENVFMWPSFLRLLM